MLIPTISSDWWTIAGNPDLGIYNSDRQQPLDFSIWQAADGSWQLGACVRRTRCGGRGRLLYRWQAESLTDENWAPMGIMLQADASVGETVGGLQAPFVIRQQNNYLMYYGDWVSICLASSDDGKVFSRRLGDDGLSGLFDEGPGSVTRDPMVLSPDEGQYKSTHYLYYTGVCNDQGAIYCRTSKDLFNWGASKIVSMGGSGGSGPSDAECAFVFQMPEACLFYLFRWHSDGLTSVYCSEDPLDFGVDHDRFKVCTLPVEVARIIQCKQKYYISSLLPDYTGMRLAEVSWLPA